MQHKLFAIAIPLLAAAATFAADVQPLPAFDSAAAFSRLKSLVGEWQADTKNGKATLSYELIAGGTALLERETAPGMAAMLTVYHMDGKRLLLTHYCMAGNQPRMEAQVYDPATNELQFRFLDATNLAAPGAGHMHNVNIRFVDAAHLIAGWQFYENNQLKFTESFDYKRVR